DTLNGGAGADTLAGGTGNDTYVFGSGSGLDAIVENDAPPGNLDSIQLGAGIDAGTVLLRFDGNDLVLSLRNSADRLTVRNFKQSAGAVEQLRFADNSVWDYARMTAEANAAPLNHAPLLSTPVADQETF